MITLSRRSDITLQAFEAVAWHGDAVAVAPEALDRMAAARAAFLRLIDDPAITVYGVTSGYGGRAGIRLKPEERKYILRQLMH